MFSQGSGLGQGASGLANILGSIFGNSGGPFSDAMKQYSKYGRQATDALNPFAKAGQGAIGDFQSWLQGQKDPAAFINKLMGSYQESPYARNLQQQSVRAANNMGSAEGTLGSTPLAQQIQQNAGNIASGDMNQWLQNVLGINTNYGAGQQSLISGGQNAANSIAQIMQHLGDIMGEGAYGQGAARNNDLMNLILGGLQFGSAPLFGG